MTEFIDRNYSNKEFEVIIKTDNKEHYKAAVYFARRLIDHAKPQTQADRILAMNYKELRDLLVDFSSFSCIFPDKDCEYVSCVECVEAYLKAPAGGVHHESYCRNDKRGVQ